MTDDEHKAALFRINALMGAEANTPEVEELSALADRVQAYEEERFPIPPPDLKVVGEIKPPADKDPVKMLRALADDIEAGDLGAVLTLAVVLKSKHGHRLFGAGVLSSLEHLSLLLSAAAVQLSGWVWAPLESLLKDTDQ